MAELRLWNRKTIIDLIELFKSHECLWKVSCPTYTNKKIKAKAYKELAEFCKKRGFADANRDFVFRKIQSLRGSFRKELRKLRAYDKKGVDYESSLWYFKHLLFTKDIENSKTRVYSNKYEDDLELYNGRWNKKCKKRDSDNDNLNESEGETQNSDIIFDCEDTEETKFDPNSMSADNAICPSISSPQEDRFGEPNRNRTDLPQLEFFDLGQEKKDPTEFDLAGMNIAKKLARMDEKQAIYAESIINSVIRRGLLKKLTEDTDLCDNLCHKQMLSMSVPQSSSQS